METESVLLHACCGPCSIMPTLRLLAEGHRIALWYMNPNIHPLSEYLRRREALGECAERLGVKLFYDDESWDMPGWLTSQLPRLESPQRCVWCCNSRLEAACKKALELGATAFSSTLLYSRYQPHAEITRAGERLAQETGLHFIYRDFREDWQKGIDLAREWGLYRQPYCGCIFSETERYAKKFRRIKDETTLAAEKIRIFD